MSIPHAIRSNNPLSAINRYCHIPPPSLQSFAQSLSSTSSSRNAVHPTRGDDELLLRRENNGVTSLLLNNPSRYNVLSSKMLDAIQLQLDDISGRSSSRVLVIGSSGNAFCSGHDLKEIQSYKKKEDAEELFRKCSKVMMSLNKLPQPVIAMVQGVATAAGCQLVASCDLAIASEDARFGVSGINAGLFCSTPAVALSRNIGRKQAFHMLVTGDLICAQEALQYGLINKVAPSAMLEEETMNLATKIASKPDFSIRLGKKMFYEQLKYNHLEDAYAFATERIVCNIEHPDAKRGIDAFVTKKNPQT